MTKKRIAIYPGTFDPITYGHLDILSRACETFDEVIVGLAEQTSKSTLFTLSERLELARSVIKTQKYKTPVRVESFGGLLIDYAKRSGARTLVRGLRAISDFEYEFQMALMNRHQAPEIETVFLMPDERYVYLSSSMVKTVGRLNGNLSKFLPPLVQKALKSKFSNR